VVVAVPASVGAIPVDRTSPVLYFQVADPGMLVRKRGIGTQVRHFLSDAEPADTPEEIERYIEAWSQPGAATGMINYYRSSVRTSPGRAEAALRPIEAPTLVIWGQRDRYLGEELAEPTTTMCRTSTASSAWPTPRTGSITTSTSASASCSPTFSPPPGQPGTEATSSGKGWKYRRTFSASRCRDLGVVRPSCQPG
jgi:hypothetical protein